MRRLAFALNVALLVAAPPASAEVLRCIDAAGKVSYTDGNCPAGTRRADRVPAAEQPPPPVAAPAPAAATPADGPSATPPPLRDAAAPPTAAPPAAPGGLVIIDPRASQPPPEPRWSDRLPRDAQGRPIGDDVYPYPPAYPPAYPYPYAHPRPPQDLRPRLRHCDASGCQDTLGNSYDRAGRLTQYQRPDGSTCRPVGTTQVCR